MRTTLFIIGFILALIGGFFATYYLFLSNGIPSGETYSEFYREGMMKRTAELENDTKIQESLQKMKSAQICGIMYNLRRSKVRSNVRSLQKCGQSSWISAEEFIQASDIRPYAPYGLKKFAILTRENQLMVITEAENGSNTLGEYKEKIPKIIDDFILLLPKIEEKEREKIEQTEKYQNDTKSEHDRVKSSFSGQ